MAHRQRDEATDHLSRSISSHQAQRVCSKKTKMNLLDHEKRHPRSTSLGSTSERLHDWETIELCDPATDDLLSVPAHSTDCLTTTTNGSQRSSMDTLLSDWDNELLFPDSVCELDTSVDSASVASTVPVLTESSCEAIFASIPHGAFATPSGPPSGRKIGTNSSEVRKDATMSARECVLIAESGKKRMCRKVAIKVLREESTRLQLQLQQLRARWKDKASMLTSGREDGSQFRSSASIWQQLAVQQRQVLNKVTSENRELRAAFNLQRKVMREVRTLLVKRATAMTVRGCHTSGCSIGKRIIQLIESVGSVCLCVFKYSKEYASRNAPHPKRRSATHSSRLSLYAPDAATRLRLNASRIVQDSWHFQPVSAIGKTDVPGFESETRRAEGGFH